MFPKSRVSYQPVLFIVLVTSIFLIQNQQIIRGIASISDQLITNVDTKAFPPAQVSSYVATNSEVSYTSIPTVVGEKEDQTKKLNTEEPNDDPSLHSIEQATRPVTTKYVRSEGELDTLKSRLELMFWPSLTGYNDRFVTPEHNGIDSHLFDRIVLHQQLYPQPLLRVKKNGNPIARHEWKFEKIIHQTWKDEQIPGRTAPWVKKWLETHPDWTYMFWTDKAAKDFIQEHYPSLWTAYESYHIPVQRADMFRYLVLYAFGGVYADLDMEVLRNLDDIRNWSSCILGREPDLQTYVLVDFLNSWGNNWTFTSNAFMACRSHHPFMHYVISRVVHWSPYILKKPCSLEATLSCTGPWMLSFAHTYYRRSVQEEMRKKRKEIDVICPDYGYFLPTFDGGRQNTVQRNCASTRLTPKRKDICKKYLDGGSKNEPLPLSYTTHHWFHSYHVDVNKDRVDVRTLTKVLQWTRDTQDADFDISYPGASA